MPPASERPVLCSNAFASGNRAVIEINLTREHVAAWMGELRIQCQVRKAQLLGPSLQGRNLDTRAIL